MPDTGCLLLSVLSVTFGAIFILFPDALMKLNGVLNRTVEILDQRLMRYRYVLGVLLLLLSYGLFQVALLLPTLRG